MNLFFAKFNTIWFNIIRMFCICKLNIEIQRGEGFGQAMIDNLRIFHYNVIFFKKH